jgi:hypothetical protein
MANGDLNLGTINNAQLASLSQADRARILPQRQETIRLEDVLTPTQNLNIAPPVQETAQPFIQGLQGSITNITRDVERLLQPTQTPAIDQERSDILGRIAELSGVRTGRAERQLQIEQEAGIPEQTRRLQELNTQIAQLTGEFNVLEQQQELDPDLTTVGEVVGRQAAIRRQRATEVGALTSIAQAVQGNLQLAQQTAARTVDLEFEPIEAEIDALKFFLDQNAESFNRSEQRRAQQLQIQLQERERLIETQKEERKSILQIAQNAANPADVLASRSVEDALIVAESRPDPLAQAELDKIRAQTDEIRRRTELIGVETGDVSGGIQVKSSQALAAQFSQRLVDANGTLDSLGPRFTGAASRFAGLVPRGLQTKDRQRFDQAERNFINAVLRRESGAAIAPSEFDSARQQYIPQPGDTPEVLAQKTRNRQVVQKGFELEAGPAANILSTALTVQDIPITINGQTTLVAPGTQVTNSRGQVGRVEADGSITIISQ